VASIAVGLGIDNVTAQSHQRWILSGHVQGNGSDCETFPNLCFFAESIVGMHAPGHGEQGCKNDRSKGYGRPGGLQKISFSHFTFLSIVLAASRNLGALKAYSRLSAGSTAAAAIATRIRVAFRISLQGRYPNLHGLNTTYIGGAELLNQPVAQSFGYRFGLGMHL
jgi:hypothetical protein